MIEILHYLKDPKLWELWYIPYYGPNNVGPVRGLNSKRGWGLGVGV